MRFDSKFYISKDLVSKDRLKMDLRVFGKGFKDAPNVLTCFGDRGGEWVLPISYGQKHWPAAEDLTENQAIDWPANEYRPRHNQQEVIDNVLEHFEEKSRCRIQCPTGFGKSVVALKVAQELGVKCLIVVHNTTILKQFEENAKNLFGIKCGWYHGKKRDIDGQVTLTTINTLHARREKETNDFWKSWGLIVYDEAHRFSAASYIAAENRLESKYALGLTATWVRADKLEGAFNIFLGPLVAKGQLMGQTTQRLLFAPTIPTNLSMRSFIDRYGNVSKAQIDTKTTSDPNLNRFIIDTVVELIEKGRRPLVVSPRLAHIDYMYDALTAVGLDCGVFAGKFKEKPVKKKDLVEAAKCDVILGSVGKVKEGLDLAKFLGDEEYKKLKPLDTVIICGIIGHAEQIAGRVGRYQDGPDILYIHPVLDMSYAKSKFNKCYKTYYGRDDVNVRKIKSLDEI